MFINFWEKGREKREKGKKKRLPESDKRITKHKTLRGIKVSRIVRVVV